MQQETEKQSPAGRGEDEGAPRRLRESLTLHLENIYPESDATDLARQVISAFWPDGMRPRRRGRSPLHPIWSERDTYVITYGNSLVDGEHKPLDLLFDFFTTRLKGIVSGVHILPYFPYTSDDGFSVTDYRAVNSILGDWQDIERIASQFRLMSDLVLNHGSSQSAWFAEYLQGHAPYDKFYFEASPEDDLSAVVRPRAHPLLREVETANGVRHVWATFSHDQIDFDFSNPDVLLEFIRIFRFHIAKGVRTVRLDAVAFVWKEVGTNCIHLPQTHEIVRLFRLLADYAEEPVVLITETNVPNVENLSYFGNRNEAHAIYNFSLPPLILHALLNGTSKHLCSWQMAMPPAQLGCAYLNFTASHDGIGLRPAESLLEDSEISDMIETVQGFGGLVSMRRMPDGGFRPYELNVTLFDALKGTVKGLDDWNVERFLCSQAIAMALEGIPAIYIHSLLATPNDLEGVEKAGYNRAINRHRWNYPELLARLADPQSLQARVFAEMKRLLAIRIRQPAFHPNATQFTLQLGETFFGFWRQSADRTQSIFAIHNLSDEMETIPAVSLNLIGGENWLDLLSGECVRQHGGVIEFAPYQCRWISNRQ
ncbi:MULTISPECIES: sugar phosphorylase [Alphaproteobacteria]|uniref:Sucrose phosphorylase n=2 Tax=Alphaproteobacteria TaxID=28211 RepID=A0A512HDF6_9HYPH|nr:MULTISPECIES: sugar phosphorylase [Alphaproteobacteria]GEO83479.1 sucrose phosphorylase [Ciceribacter naphthalenivorans]GLR24370.1 sucrose phosphorylase [Ciceribacter naphthalenivorans]GLT07226.1 sucrose phosphorylase [Sphingomonas psychrolutea]